MEDSKGRWAGPSRVGAGVIAAFVTCFRVPSPSLVTPLEPASPTKTCEEKLGFSILNEPILFITVYLFYIIIFSSFSLLGLP